MTTFLGVWPITDDTLTLDALAAEAEVDLVRLAWEQGAVVTGTPSWTVAEGTITGHASPTGLYLLCEADARKATA